MLLTIFIVQSGLYAQNNIDKEDNFNLLLESITQKLQQTTGEKIILKKGDPIKNEEYIKVAAQILGILHSNSLNLPESALVVEDKKSGVEETFALFLDDPAKKEASGFLIQAWKKNPQATIYFTDTALLSCMWIAAEEFDSIQRDKVIKLIDAILVENARQSKPDQQEINLGVLCNAVLNKVGATSQEMDLLLRNTSIIKNEQFLKISTAMIGVLYRHLPSKVKAQLKEMAHRSSKASRADALMAAFMIDPADQSAQRLLLCAWQIQPVVTIRFIANMLLYHMENLASSANQNTIDTIIQEITAL